MLQKCSQTFYYFHYETLDANLWELTQRKPNTGTQLLHSVNYQQYQYRYD